MRSSENRQGVQLLEAAIRREPSNPRVLVMAAWGYEARIHMGWPLEDGDVARGPALAQRAITLAGSDAGSLAHCAIVLQVCGDEWEQGLAVAKRALELNPNDIGVLFFNGIAHLKGGSLDRAREMFERAAALGTDLSGNALAGLANVALVEGHLEAALDLGRRAVASRPVLGWIHWPAIAAAALLGRSTDAAKAFAAYRAHDPDATLSRISFGQRCREPQRMSLLIEGMRLAGLPE
jgi:tetratricopeptide (TPR) repeat protein